MNKLRALTTYLIGLNLVLPEQIDSWAEQVNLDLIWKDTTQGLHMDDHSSESVGGIKKIEALGALKLLSGGSASLAAVDDLHQATGRDLNVRDP